MVYRIYVEKKAGFDREAKLLTEDVRCVLGAEGVEKIRVINRYDVEGIDEALFEKAVRQVFSEPKTDDVFNELSVSDGEVFATEYLSGQFDRRADSAAQCIQMISKGERPLVRTAKIYVVYGENAAAQVQKIKRYVINPIECREASESLPETLKTEYEAPLPIERVTGFLEMDEAALRLFLIKNSFAMDLSDLTACRDYFRGERRDPTMTELKVIDTYWSDHCRHTTFLTTIDAVHFDDEIIQQAFEEYMRTRREIGRNKPVNLMDIATIACKLLRHRGFLTKIDESEEGNACSVKITVDVDGVPQNYLLFFKNETNNHTTEIDPFGGAATCIGGAIRDPLSGRSYVYAAMRVTGAGDPTRPVDETPKGKLPQRKIVTAAAEGYSSYSNQAGLATGQVEELYHSGYVAKRLEIGAVLGATNEENVRRECPEAGDIVILLGGKTGRDGCGGATGASKSHTAQSLSACGMDVQNGNALEERKLQRLFRNGDAMRLVKRCNDLGAGGVAVAIGELAEGVNIDLDRVSKKYAGLDGTELAISESQERMAVVVEADFADAFISYAKEENLEATAVATVTAEPRLVMRWCGQIIVDIARKFLDSNGAEKHVCISVPAPLNYQRETSLPFDESYRALARDLNVCSKRGLCERFDATIGAGTVLMPFGGRYQMTRPQAMVHLIPVENGHTDDVSFMSFGYNPYIAEKSPYHGAYLAVLESVCKLIATGASFDDVYLSFQEYFLRPGRDVRRWGQPLAALLGAFKAQTDLGIAAIGGKDSMSGTFEKSDVPPTLVSFAVTTGKTRDVLSPEFKGAGHKVALIEPERDGQGLPIPSSLKETFALITNLIREKKVLSVYAPAYGGIAEGVMQMCFGNGFGFAFEENVSVQKIFGYSYGSFIVELAKGVKAGNLLGTTLRRRRIFLNEFSLELAELKRIYEERLESVYSTAAGTVQRTVETFTYKKRGNLIHAAHPVEPKVLIPVFPGTNCEYDTAKAFRDAGANTEIFVVRNRDRDDLLRSIEAFARKIDKSNILFLASGFSGGDEPNGSGKFITAFFRNEEIRTAVEQLLMRRDGLMGGIGNGFQALIRLGLVPYGKIVDASANSPTLTFNDIGRHRSRIVNVRVDSVHSPWLRGVRAGQVFQTPVSHGEGKFIASVSLINELAANGQIMTQYVDEDGKPTMNPDFNPNGSYSAVEGLLSPDGRVFGKMGHAERKGAGLYKNVSGEYDMKLFESAVKYFK